MGNLGVRMEVKRKGRHFLSSSFCIVRKSEDISNGYWWAVCIDFRKVTPIQSQQFLLYRKVNQPYIYIHPLFFGFPSYLGRYRVLNRVP